MGFRAGAAAMVTASVMLVGVVACTDEPEPDPVDEDQAAAETFGAKPDVPAMLPPDRNAPPQDVQALDLVEGDGDEAVAGSVVTVHYAAAVWHEGVELDSTWDVDEPYTFELGAGRVIEGWERGVGGRLDGVGPMRVGGRRMLTIPPHQAYGDRGAGPAIGPGETLVFVIDLLDVGAAGSDT